MATAKRRNRAAFASGKPWDGRFREKTNRLVEGFTVSVAVDRRLYAHDIQGSIAHCKTLGKARVLSPGETRTIVRGLESVKTELDRERFRFAPHDEDIHMAIERRLTELIGPLGGKLHTGRSRNDQVALDLRLYLRDQLNRLVEQLTEFQRVLVAKAKANRTIAMPGYTHLQRAQPVLFAHHLLAYVEMLERDKGRVRDARTRLNVMPLGSGALAGTNYPVDRRYTAGLLDFPAVTANSVDAVSDRDFTIEVASALSIAMMHLSRLSEELIVWSSQEFQFVDLPDAFCTGSSMMPQKKNPDVPELVRGKTGRVYGHLVNLLTTLKALPLSYNRDLQEDKPALFDALDTLAASLQVMTELMRRLKVNREALKRALQGGCLLATELADYLVARGVPFRESHGITGRIVRAALDRGHDLTDFSLKELRTFSERIEKGVFARLTVSAAIDRKRQIGGTARGRVEQRIKELERLLS
ncbi:MAG: argininosuccinate lyase [Nitrospira sp.]|nr:MAG: argininosuccinate lyase [Nitrospira sp.]